MYTETDPASVDAGETDEARAKYGWLPVLPMCVGVLVPANFLLHQLGRTVAGLYFPWVEVLIPLIALAFVGYFGFLVFKAAGVLLAGRHAHPIDRWLCLHSSVISIIGGVVLISAMVALMGQGRHRSLAGMRVILTLSEVGLLFALTYLLPHSIEPRPPGSPVILCANLLVAAIAFGMLLAVLLASLQLGMEAAGLEKASLPTI